MTPWFDKRLVPPQRSSPDIKGEMFELLYQVLHQNWRYFFKTSVLASVQRGVAEDTMENEAQFTAAMQVGLPFLHQTLHVTCGGSGPTDSVLPLYLYSLVHVFMQTYNSRKL